MPLLTSPEITNRTPLGLARAPGWFPVIAGAALFAVGVGAVFQPGIFHSALEIEAEAPPGLVKAIGIPLLGFGAAALLSALAGGLAWIRRQHRSGRFPGEPWRMDFPWDPSGIGSERPRWAIGRVLGGAAMALFLVPFAWWGFVLGSTAVRGAVVFFGLVALAVAAHGLWTLLLHWRDRCPRLLFDQFPYFLGARFTVRLDSVRPLRRCRSLNARLLCLDEIEAPDGSSSDGTQSGTTTVCRRLYTDRLDIPPSHWQHGEGELPLAFELPFADLATRLSARHPRYWVLELRGDRFEADFLLPVYSPGEVADRPTPPPCPTCGSTDLAEFLYGYPADMDALKPELDAGRIVLGGCEISATMPDWKCNRCQREF